MIKFLILLGAIAYASAASVKREEYNAADSLLALANQVNANRDSNVASNNSPVYNPNSSPNIYPSYSASYGNQAISNQNANNVALNYAASQSDTNQAYADNVAAATSNIPSTQPNQQAYPNLNQGNLYYYYYPVQDKNKEITYQASPSNQYTSSIQPQNSNDEQSNQNNANLNNQQQQQLANAQQQNPGHDLSYGGAQDLAYTASGLAESSQNGAQQGGNYADNQQFSNLASTLSQYNFGSGSNGNAFGSQFANQLSGLNNLGFGEAFSGSMAQPSSVPFDPSFTSAMASQLGSSLGNFQPSSSSGSGASSGGPLSQLYQQAAQVYQGYQGLLNGQSANQQPQFAASQHSPSYEPSTGGSSFRSKYGIGSIMMPLIALAGLSLLIPSLSTVTSRKKRSVEDKLDLQQTGLGAYLERMDRYYSIYKNAIEREECINRIICELGDAVSGVRGKDAFFDFVDRVMPNGWMSKGNSKVSIFKTSALSSNDNSKCKKYRCH